jgi:hypothetical protein
MLQDEDNSSTKSQQPLLPPLPSPIQPTQNDCEVFNSSINNDLE